MTARERERTVAKAQDAMRQLAAALAVLGDVIEYGRGLAEPPAATVPGRQDDASRHKEP